MCRQDYPCPGNPNLATALGAATLALRAPANSAADQLVMQNTAVAQAVDLGASMPLGDNMVAIANHIYRNGDDYETDHMFNLGLQINLQ